MKTICAYKNKQAINGFLSRIIKKGMIYLSLILMISLLFPFSSAFAEDEGEDLGSKPDMGMPKFDANQMSSFQVNETNGNVVIQYNIMTIPNPRGPDVEVFLTYNSQNFHSYSVTGSDTEDPPVGIIGRGCWSFSRVKSLKTESLYRIESIGSWGEMEGVGISVGDVVSETFEWEAPDYGSFLSDLEDQIGDTEDTIDDLEEALEDMEGSLAELQESKHYIQSVQIPELLDQLNDLNLYWLELDSQYETLDGYCIGLGEDYQDWQDLSEEANYERDGSPEWLSEEDWITYQSLGGNDGYIYEDEFNDCPEQLAQKEDAKEEIDDFITGINDQIDELGGQVTEIEGDIGTLINDIPEAQQNLYDAKNSLDELETQYAYYDELNSNFDPTITFLPLGDYAVYESGDGDGWWLLDSCWSPQSNPYHVDVDTGGLTFKDGTSYSCGNPGVASISDRYGNTSPLMGEVMPGRWVEFSNQTDNGMDVIIRSGTDERIFHIALLGGKVSSITNPETETTYFDYYPVEHWNVNTDIGEGGFVGDGEEGEWVNLTGVPQSFEVDRCLIRKIKDPNDCETHFEYADVELIYGHIKTTWERPRRCTRVYKSDGSNIIKDTQYEYKAYGDNYRPSKDDEVYQTIITDSNDNPTIKDIGKKVYDYKEIEGFETPILDKKFVEKITDPYAGETEYGYENLSLTLDETIDTNDLTHSRLHDNLGNLLKLEASLNSLPVETTYYTYESNYSQIASITDANGNKSEFGYVDSPGDEHGPKGVMWSEIDPEFRETEHWYNSSGQRIRTRDPRGINTVYGYCDTYYYLNSIKVYDSYPGGSYHEKTFTYDGFGNKLSETDYNGNLTEYTYDGLNRPLTETVHDGNDTFVTTYYYADGLLDRKVNPKGAVTKYQYDGFNRLVKVYEAYQTNDQITREYGYDSENNKISETDANGNEHVFEYDALNRLISEKGVSPDKTEITYEYGGSGDSSTDGGSPQYDRSKDRYTKKTVANVDSTGMRVALNTTFEYDDLYRLIKETDPLGNDVEYGYDAVGNKISEIDKNENETTYEYYDDNALKKVIDPYLNYEQYFYDGSGNKIRVQDKLGNSTYSTYDALNRMTCQTDAEGGAVYATWDGINKISERDKNGNWTEFSFNGRNLLTDAYFAISGVSSSIDYDANGNKVEETDPNGNIVKYEYNLLDRLTKETKGYGVLNLDTTYTYDDNGNRKTITDAEGNTTTYSYNYLNQVIYVQDPLYGSVLSTSYGYDLLGNKVWVIDKNGHRKEFFYDELSRLVGTENAKGITESFDYDGEGNRVEWVNGNVDTITYEYDDLNRLTKKSYGLSSFTEFSYDANGNRILMTDDNGTTTYTYDDVNRLLSEASPGPNGSRTVSYTYYPNGERETMTAPGSRVTEYDYDAMNRLITLTDPDDGETTYEFDAGSRLTEMEYPNGVIAEYDQYDEANRLIHMWTTDSSATTTFTEFTYAYDSVGNRTQIQDTSGTTNFVYDDLYQLVSATYPDSSTATYYYDPVGNREREIVSGVEKNYVYNELNQLVAWTTSTSPLTMDYSVVGLASDNDDLQGVWVNGTEATFVDQTWTAQVTFTIGTNVIEVIAKDDAGNTVTTSREVYYRPDMAGRMEYFYDDNGCLVEKKGDDGSQFMYEYTLENRLTQVTLADSTTCEFTYDGDLRRVARKNPDGSELWFLHDGVNILMDEATDGTPWAYYNQGIGIDKMVSVVEWAGQTTSTKKFYHSDAIGSVRAITDESQSQAQTYSYDAWGNVTASFGSCTDNEYRFTSRRWEGDIGLQYNRARFYDPQIGRFITPDPLTGGPDDPKISYFGGVYSAFHRFLKEYVDAMQPHKLNRYVYCTNNPVNLIDPLGLSSDEDGPESVGSSVEQNSSKSKGTESTEDSDADLTDNGQTDTDVADQETGYFWKNRNKFHYPKLKDLINERSWEKAKRVYDRLSNYKKSKILENWLTINGWDDSGYYDGMKVEIGTTTASAGESTFEKLYKGRYLGTAIAEESALYWIKRANNAEGLGEGILYTCGGLFASLWTSDTWYKTLGTLTTFKYIDTAFIQTNKSDKAWLVVETIIRLWLNEPPSPQNPAPPPNLPNPTQWTP